jgi:hypothetical protein
VPKTRWTQLGSQNRTGAWGQDDFSGFRARGAEVLSVREA